MFTRTAKAARKALSLDRDGVFLLLVVMTALLGWVLSMGAGMVIASHGVYKNWHLDREKELIVYLLADTVQEDITMLTDKLKKYDGVSSVKQVSAEEIQKTLQPYFTEEQAFPIPTVIRVEVLDSSKINAISDVVYNIFPTAEVDDNRQILAKASHIVRITQIGMMILGSVVSIVMALLVVLTVRAGLRGQKRRVAVLKFLGGTNGFMAQLVVQQVVVRSFIGWLLSCIMAGIVLVGIMLWQPAFKEIITHDVWGAVIVAPLLLPFITMLAAMITARAVVEGDK